MLGAGLKGIEEKLKLPPPLEKNLFYICQEETTDPNLKEMPGNLLEAIQIAEKYYFLKEILGEHVCWYYLESKKAEWDKFCTSVTDREVREYRYAL